MKKFVSLSMLAAMMAVTLSASSASADDREGYREGRRCTWVRKCHRDDGVRVCERVRVCRDRH